MTTFGIIDGTDQTVAVNPTQLRMLIAQVEDRVPVCYLVWDRNDHVKVKGTLNEVLGSLGIQSVRLEPVAQETRSQFGAQAINLP